MRRMVLCVKSRLGPETVGRSQERVVCFDLGGVLLRGDPGLSGRLARLFGVSRVAIDRAVMDHAIADDLILGVQTPRAACAVLNEAFGTTISRAAFVRAWTRGLHSSTANVRFLPHRACRLSTSRRGAPDSPASASPSSSLEADSAKARIGRGRAGARAIQMANVASRSH